MTAPTLSSRQTTLLLWPLLLAALCLSWDSQPAVSAKADDASGKEAEATPGDAAADPASQPSAPAQAMQGKVVFAVRENGGLKKQDAAESESNLLALETFEGELHQLVEDVRGRAFRQDERLRQWDVELLAEKAKDQDAWQVIGVRKLDRKTNRKYEVDYWCDICAIAMYELKPCDCCQGPIELRLRELKTADDPR